MRVRRQFLWVLVTVLTGLAIPGAAFLAQNQQENSPAVRQKTAEVVWKTINDKYFDPKLGGVDWVAVRARYAPQVATVKTDQELYDLLDRMLQELRISHVRTYDISTLEKLMARAEVNTGLVLRDVGGEVVVTRVRENSPAQKGGLRSGYVIKQVDGVAVTNARLAESTIAVEGRKHELHFVDESGMTRQAVLEHQLPPAEQLLSAPLIAARRYVFFESRRLDGDVGYIHFTNFIEPVKKRVQAEFQAMKDAPGIIVDFRGNSGGEAFGPELAGMMLTKPEQLAITRTRKGDDYYYKTKPQKNPYIGPVVILIDEESGSESEQATAGLQELGRVIVIGKRSRGVVMDATLAELPTGGLLLYPIGQPRTPKGVVLEGRGVIPDVEVSLTHADLLKGRDSQLQAAIDTIEKQKGSGPRANRP